MDQIVSYIKNLQTQKIPDAQIKEQLLKTGWSEADITQAFAIASKSELPVAPVPPPHKSSILSSDFDIWITFAHVLLFISLYVAAISLGMLIAQFIDIWIPAAATPGSYAMPGTVLDMAMKASIAALIVSWPTFSGLFIYINRKKVANPAIRNIRSRKNLIYMTLVVTFVIVLSNLISTVFGFLNGTITANFLAHLANILIISGTIFVYLFNEVRQDRKLAA